MKQIGCGLVLFFSQAIGRSPASWRGTMNRLRHCWISLVLVLICLSLSGCNNVTANDSRPKVLRYAFSPQAEQLQSGELRRDLMRKYLESQLHMPVEVIRVEGYGPTIEAMRTEKVDLATFGSLSYIIAAQKAGAEAIAARGFADGSLGGYRSVIAVPKDSPIHSLQELKAHAKDLVFAFADPASTSGNLYPRVGLLDAGIDPEKDFKKVVYAGNHIATALTVKSGKVGAAGFMQSIIPNLVTKNKMRTDDVRVIWTSDLIPNSCYAVRKGLPEELKKQIQTALVEVPTRDPELWVHLNSLLRTSDSGTRNVAVTDATYDGLRRYAAKVKDFKFVEE